ncbi:MAG: outer membrane protein assembly factor BamC [Limnobacter sp.]|nr:outer membrane protein assembly factor BamC [Limnobacter sp.]
MKVLKFSNLTQPSVKLSVQLAVSLTVLSLAGCASYDNAIEGQKAIYQKAEKRTVKLDVPPDLTAQSADEQFLLPGEGTSGSVSAAEFYSGKQPVAGGVGSGRAQGGARAQVDPVLATSDEVEIRTLGRVRSLVVKRPPEQLWPALRDFWRENGFELTNDDPKTGLMETNWSENRAAIPMDGIRKVIGRVFDNLYSSNTRDRYRLRVEPNADGTSEIFITHRGMEENFMDKSQTQLAWMNRPSDPELEAEMLNKLVVKLTGNAQAKDKKGLPVQQLVTINKSTNGASLTLAEDFPLAWRRVGFGLDRAGFVVEDRDRANGIYYVKYLPDSAAATPGEKKGFFGSIFSSKGESLSNDQRFQVLVSAKGQDKTEVRFASETGKVLNAKLSSEASDRLVAKLR